MSFGQALEALKAGKRVALPNWKYAWLAVRNGEISLVNRDGGMIRGYSVSGHEALLDTWMVMEDPGMSFADAIKLLKDGKRVRRTSWMSEASLVAAGNTLWLYITHEKDVFRERWYPELESLEATDWQEVK